MKFIIIDILLIPVGWLALFIRYRKQDKMNEVLIKEYDNSYSNAAKDMVSSLVLILFGILLIVFMVGMVTVSIINIYNGGE